MMTTRAWWESHRKRQTIAPSSAQRNAQVGQGAAESNVGALVVAAAWHAAAGRGRARAGPQCTESGTNVGNALASRSSTTGLSKIKYRPTGRAGGHVVNAPG